MNTVVSWSMHCSIIHLLIEIKQMLHFFFMLGKSIYKLKFSVSDSKILISQALGVPVSRLVQDADSVSV